MEDLEIKKILKFFKEISDIPRKSGNEEKIKEYLVKFAVDRNLEYYTDEYFNVIIRKNASPKYENYDYLALQAHTDMVCEKEEWSCHNFEKDSIEIIEDEAFLRANGTTLGADNGIGVSIMLAILDSEEIEIPKLECIFTVQEETTMIGSKKIDIQQIKSKRIISLDGGREGKMVISSANCMEWFGKIKKEYIEIENLNTYELEYSNFKGGHSGGNIADEKRGNPIKLGICSLSKIRTVYINEIQGGSMVNVIPRDFKVRFSCEELSNEINTEIENQKNFYGKDVKIELKKVNNEEQAFSQKTTMQIINFISTFANGALNFDENGNQILSANFGAIREVDDFVRVEYSVRSNDLVFRKKYLDNLQKNLKENGIEVIWSQELKGFEPDYNSSLVTKTSDLYKKIFNKKMKKIITQGVVEGGFFKDRITDLEYICIGANIEDAHSPKERVSVESIKNIWKLVRELVKVRF